MSKWQCESVEYVLLLVFGAILLMASSNALASPQKGENSKGGESAEENQHNPLEASGIQVGIGGLAMLSFNDFCEREWDIVSCQRGMLTLGGQLNGLYRTKWNRFSLGLVASLLGELNGSEEVSDGVVSGYERFFIWRVAAEARLYPLKRKVTELWFLLELGIAGASQYHVAVAGNDRKNTELMGNAFAPDVGLGAGMDFKIYKGFYLGFEMRALLLGFKKSDSKWNGNKTEFGPGIWPVLGLVNIGYIWNLN